MSTQQPPPFFIVACARSGTTLLQTMLNRHPEVAIPPESHFIPALWRRRKRYGESGRVERLDLFLHDLTETRRFKFWDLPKEELWEDLGGANGPAPTFSEAVAAPFRRYARGVGKPRWGDKTPVYVEEIPLLASLFPSARFVHVVRDGRDVALSMMELNRLHRGAASAGLVWARRVRKGRGAGEALEPERYHEVLYEQMVEDPEAVLRQVCRFLDLPFDPTMLRHQEGASKAIPEQIRWMHRRLDLPPTTGLRDWRTEMDPAEVARFEALAGEELTAFGYPVGPRPRLITRLAAWGQVGAFAGRVVARRARVLLGDRSRSAADGPVSRA